MEKHKTDYLCEGTNEQDHAQEGAIHMTIRNRNGLSSLRIPLLI